MWIFELIIEMLSFVDDIRFARRYGWGSFLWGLVFVICGAAACLFFEIGFAILGVISVAGAVASFVQSCRCSWREIREKREEEARTRQQKAE